MSEIAGGIVVILIFLGMSSPIIIVGLVYYLKKRLEHKQILASIEKGTPLSELRPPKPKGPLWIKNITTGITFLIIAAGFVCIPPMFDGGMPFAQALFGHYIIATVFFAIGVSSLVRGLLQRKYPPQEPPTGCGDTGESNKAQNL
ncbi:MAG: hypothetical protein JSW23_03405 [Planctomycetota bacterium]|nr:MAG: hypothetical protein JSW23_03405 [Planctomycetota bacterium]